MAANPIPILNGLYIPSAAFCHHRRDLYSVVLGGTRYSPRQVHALMSTPMPSTVAGALMREMLAQSNIWRGDIVSMHDVAIEQSQAANQELSNNLRRSLRKVSWGELYALRANFLIGMVLLSSDDRLPNNQNVNSDDNRSVTDPLWYDLIDFPPHILWLSCEWIPAKSGYLVMPEIPDDAFFLIESLLMVPKFPFFFSENFCAPEVMILAPALPITPPTATASNVDFIEELEEEPTVGRRRPREESDDSASETTESTGSKFIDSDGNVHLTHGISKSKLSPNVAEWLRFTRLLPSERCSLFRENDLSTSVVKFRNKMGQLSKDPSLSAHLRSCLLWSNVDSPREALSLLHVFSVDSFTLAFMQAKYEGSAYASGLSLWDFLPSPDREVIVNRYKTSGNTHFFDTDARHNLWLSRVELFKMLDNWCTSLFCVFGYTGYRTMYNNIVDRIMSVNPSPGPYPELWRLAIESGLLTFRTLMEKPTMKDVFSTPAWIEQYEGRTPIYFFDQLETYILAQLDTLAFNTMVYANPSSAAFELRKRVILFLPSLPNDSSSGKTLTTSSAASGQSLHENPDTPKNQLICVQQMASLLGISTPGRASFVNCGNNRKGNGNCAECRHFLSVDELLKQGGVIRKTLRSTKQFGHLQSDFGKSVKEALVTRLKELCPTATRQWI